VEKPQDRFLVYGIIQVGAKWKTLIKDKKAPGAKVATYTVGDSLTPGQVIRSIDDRKVVVAWGGGEAELKLRGPKGSEDTGFVPKAVPVAQPVLTDPGGRPGQTIPSNVPPLPGRPGQPSAAPPPHGGQMQTQPQRPGRQPVEIAPPVDEFDEDMEGDDEEYIDEEDEE
jgi:hypothetical protein